MQKYTPFEFACSIASKTEQGILVIKAEEGQPSYVMFRLLDDDVMDALRLTGYAIVDDITLEEANLAFQQITASYHSLSVPSYCAAFIHPSGAVAATWSGGRNGKAILRDKF